MGAILSEELLGRVRSRAAGYDAANRFPEEDLAELADAGYLAAAVPAALGGSDLTVVELAHEQMRLAGAAPATALAVNMHQVWVAVARGLNAAGDHSADFVLSEAVAGEVFAFGISEPGNDLVLFGSTSEARPDGAGGYTFHGRKTFTSLSPVWTRLGTFGIDRTGAEPHSVFAFVERDEGGFEILDDWDTLGMRASRSCTTVLDGAHAPAERVVRRIPPGRTRDRFVLEIFGCFEILLGAVYVGIAERALEVAVAAVQERSSRKRGGAPLATDPDVRVRLARTAIALDGIRPQIDALARDLEAGVDRGERWLPQLSAAKFRAVEVARSVVQESLRAAGGSAYFAGSELSRLYRDVTAGMFHPSNDESVIGAWGDLLFGPIEPA